MLVSWVHLLWINVNAPLNSCVYLYSYITYKLLSTCLWWNLKGIVSQYITPLPNYLQVKLKYKQV